MLTLPCKYPKMCRADNNNSNQSNKIMHFFRKIDNLKHEMFIKMEARHANHFSTLLIRCNHCEYTRKYTYMIIIIREKCILKNEQMKKKTSCIF